jgi:hypothetical protein
MNTRKAEFNRNFDWQKTLYDKVIKIIRALSPYFVHIEIASDEQDKQESTDFVIKVKSSDARIAVRIRRFPCKYRDFTIRAVVPSGYATELDKLKTNEVRWYFYAWLNEAGELAEYMLVNLDKAREAGLLNRQKQVRYNPDGTGFISFSLAELQLGGCITFQRGLA